MSGFATTLEFLKEDFACPNCTETPDYIVVDGKSLGPTARQVDHISEHDRHVADDQVLVAGTEFQDRVFISNTRERKLIK